MDACAVHSDMFFDLEAVEVMIIHNSATTHSYLTLELSLGMLVGIQLILGLANIPADAHPRIALQRLQHVA